MPSLGPYMRSSTVFTHLFKIKISYSRSNTCLDSPPIKKGNTLYCSYRQTLSKLWREFVMKCCACARAHSCKTVKYKRNPCSCLLY